MSPDKLSSFLEDGSPIIHVVLADVRGSSPRETGAEMFVTHARTLGTIGGGRLEYLAIKAARELLATGTYRDELDVPLGPEIGQCCGGRVAITLTLMSEVDRRDAVNRCEVNRDARPQVYILGGGHVGRALANQFQHLPYHCVIVDQRENELSLCEATVETRISAIPEINIRNAAAGSAFIVSTHDHALDFLLTAAALDRGDSAYVGLIGSKTKRAKFEQWMREHHSALDLDRLICPIGSSEIRDKRPEIIASFVVAEVVAALSQHHTIQGKQIEVQSIPARSTGIST